MNKDTECILDISKIRWNQYALSIVNPNSIFP